VQSRKRLQLLLRLVGRFNCIHQVGHSAARHSSGWSLASQSARLAVDVNKVTTNGQTHELKPCIAVVQTQAHCLYNW